MQKAELINKEISLNLGDERKFAYEMNAVIIIAAYPPPPPHTHTFFSFYTFCNKVIRRQSKMQILLLRKFGRNGGQQMKFDTSRTGERKIFSYERKVHRCLTVFYGKIEELELFKDQLEKVKTLHKGNKPPSVHVMGDFNFRDIVWPDRLNKLGFSLSVSEGAKLVELISDHELEQVVHFPTRGQNTLDLIITSLPGQFVDIHSPDRLSDHDIVSGTLKIVIPPIKKPKRKVYKYQKGDYESMKGDALKFAKEKYFNGYSVYTLYFLFDRD